MEPNRSSLIDLLSAEKFLTTLGGSNTQFCFQTFTNKEHPRKFELTRILNGTFSNCISQLIDLNGQGAGIYVTVNETDGNGRKKENILRVRAHFVDDDNCLLKANVEPKPSMVIKSVRGLHLYWLVEGANLDIFESIQLALSEKFQTDPSVKDVSRVMRVPGFLHYGNPENPTCVSLLSVDPALIYKQSDFGLTDGISKVTSGRNNFLTSVGGVLRNKGNDREQLQKALGIVNQQMCAPSLLESEVQSVANSVGNYPVGRGNQPSRNVKQINHADLADAFLRSRSENGSESTGVVEYNGSTYVYTDGFYKKLTKDEAKRVILKWLRSNPHLRDFATLNHARDILANIQTATEIPLKLNVPFRISSHDWEHQLLNLKNGCLALGPVVKGENPSFQPSGRDIFFLGRTDYPFNPTASCPTWDKFLVDILPEKELRELLQDWFGYNLIFDNSLSKIFLFVGDGANGKSVVCKVLRLLIGEHDVSTVPLGAFASDRTFQIAETDGKKSNIVEEIGEYTKVAEDTLKNYVTEGTQQVEKKNRDPFDLRCTARLTFAANQMPRIYDRSNGIARRLIILPFTQTIKPEKQNPNLLKREWWIESGELSGILNWAVEGLRRLYLRGEHKFPFLFVPPMVENQVQEFVRDSNPHLQYIDENLRVTSFDRELSSRKVYSSYTEWMLSSGYKPLGEGQFARELKKHLKVECTKNVKKDGNLRSRYWLGLAFIDSTPEFQPKSVGSLDNLPLNTQSTLPLIPENNGGNEDV